MHITGPEVIMNLAKAVKTYSNAVQLTPFLYTKEINLLSFQTVQKFQDGAPCKVGVAMTDLATGLYAHGAIMAAILDRQKTGFGQKIDCNLLSTQVFMLFRPIIIKERVGCLKKCLKCDIEGVVLESVTRG